MLGKTLMRRDESLTGKRNAEKRLGKLRLSRNDILNEIAMREARLDPHASYSARVEKEFGIDGIRAERNKLKRELRDYKERLEHVDRKIVDCESEIAHFNKTLKDLREFRAM